jgi:integrase
MSVDILLSLVLLLRYSGMRISDVVGLAVGRIVGNRLFLYTAKTGTPVHVILPDFVVEAVEKIPSMSDRYYFWTGVGLLRTAVRVWETRLRRLFKLAGVVNGHAHRFRDTFAVELLLAGVPLERVSVLLGHQSIRVTERHYAPWVRSRQEQLERDLESAWSRDPLILLHANHTRERRAPELNEWKRVRMVRKVGFEPTRLAAPPPQDGASASSATSAQGRVRQEF